MKTIVYILRHGQYESPNRIVPYRLPGFHLSQKGIIDVTATASRLAGSPVADVFTSPMERTAETAAIVAKPHGLTPVLDARLLETRSPAQGKPEEFSDSMGGWHMYETDWYKGEGGESIEEIFTRVYGCFEEKVTQYKGKDVILVTHGDPVMLLVSHLQGLPHTPDALENVPYVPMAGGWKVTLVDDQPPKLDPIGVQT